jgi:hypothetical protein
MYYRARWASSFPLVLNFNFIFLKNQAIPSVFFGMGADTSSSALCKSTNGLGPMKRTNLHRRNLIPKVVGMMVSHFFTLRRLLHPLVHLNDFNDFCIQREYVLVFVPRETEAIHGLKKT